jgi:hypothetical protein
LLSRGRTSRNPQNKKARSSRAPSLPFVKQFPPLLFTSYQPPATNNNDVFASKLRFPVWLWPVFQLVLQPRFTR